HTSSKRDWSSDVCSSDLPQLIHDMHFDFVLGDAPGRRWRGPDSPPLAGDRVLSAGQPDLVLLDRRFSPSVAVMKRHPEWVLLYRSEERRVGKERTNRWPN